MQYNLILNVNYSYCLLYKIYSQIYADPRIVNAEQCLNKFLDENRVLFAVEYVDYCQLVIELHRIGVLSNGEKDYYCSPVTLNADTRALRFNEFTQRLKDIAKLPRNNIIRHLFLALRNTYEEGTGGKSDNHYYLAKSLRNIGIFSTCESADVCGMV